MLPLAAQFIAQCVQGTIKKKKPTGMTACGQGFTVKRRPPVNVNGAQY